MGHWGVSVTTRSRIRVSRLTTRDSRQPVIVDQPPSGRRKIDYKTGGEREKLEKEEENQKLRKERKRILILKI